MFNFLPAYWPTVGYTNATRKNFNVAATVEEATTEASPITIDPNWSPFKKMARNAYCDNAQSREWHTAYDHVVTSLFMAQNALESAKEPSVIKLYQARLNRLVRDWYGVELR
tara:strand:+ start:415 stop:750 length:336 start_codon:yes stop_codon:yes gene_type:complete